MTESTYTGSIDSHPDGHHLSATLPEVTSPLGPCTSATYPDVPYTTTSPFAYPSACDPILLTPVSSVGSPPMQQRSRLSRGYTPTGSSQQPTPPASSKMGWNSAFEMSAPTSQSGSPMTVHPSSVSEDPFPMPYGTADAKDQIPEPPEPYYGPFTVSAESAKQNPGDGRMAPYYQPVTDSLSPGTLMGHHTYPVMHNPMHSMPNHMMSEPSAYPPPRGNDVGHMPSFHPHSMPGSSTSRGVPFPNKISKASRGKAPSRRGKRPGEGLEAVLSSNCVDMTDEPIQLRDDTPEEERFLLELRLKWKDTKGKNMWEEIRRQYQEKYGKKVRRESLQMKMSRLKAQWVIWSQRDLDILRQVALEDEAQRYDRILKKFTEQGGGRQLGFNKTNIEVKLVEMGVEDFYMDPESKIRPRKRLCDKRKGNGKRRSRPMGSDIMSNDDLTMGSSMRLSDEQTDELYDQITSIRGGAHDHESSMEGDEAEVKMEEGGPSVEGGAHPSQRVARQACQELMKSSHVPNEHRYYDQTRDSAEPL